jgi:hypothetical protein
MAPSQQRGEMENQQHCEFSKQAIGVRRPEEEIMPENGRRGNARDRKKM